jgi:hypothetical protein
MRPDADKDGVHLTLINGEGADVPAELIHAVHMPDLTRFRPAWIRMLPRPDMLITLAAGPADETDPARIWRFLRAPHGGHGRIGPYARADMPLPLVAYVSGSTIVLSTRLTAGELQATARMTRRSWRARFPDGLRHAITPPAGTAALGTGRALQTAANGPGPLGAAAAGVAMVLATITAVVTSPAPAGQLPLHGVPRVAAHAAQPGRPSAAPRPLKTAVPPSPGRHRAGLPLSALPRPPRLLQHPIAATVGRHPVRSLATRQKVTDVSSAAGLSWPDSFSRQMGGVWRPGTIRDALRRGAYSGSG